MTRLDLLKTHKALILLGQGCRSECKGEDDVAREERMKEPIEWSHSVRLARNSGDHPRGERKRG